MSHKLLLADDSVTIQRVIELTFADEDVEVVTAGDGEQAIASIQSERPDIVLADIGMPKRSGYDVAEFVKRAPELSHIPVLLLTGAFEPVDERRAHEAGCDGVLVKPFEPQHVIARVRELLHGSGGTAPRPAGTVSRAVADIPRPVERLTPTRPAAARPDPERPHSDLDDYFDRLDAAFANISPADAPARSQEGPQRREGPVMERDLDWFDTPSQPASPEPPAIIDVPPAAPASEPIPVTLASPPISPAWPGPQAPTFEPADTPPDRAPQPPRRPQAAAAAPAEPAATIADVFSALLAAEQGDADAASVRIPLATAAPAVNDELINEVARRVMERLSSSSMHDVIVEVVSQVAERLVREEIERIRNRHSV